MEKQSKSLLPTAEKIFLSNRRKFLQKVGILSVLPLLYKAKVWGKSLFNFKPNPSYQAPSGVSSENLFTSYNNYYEYSLEKSEVKDLAQKTATLPWSIEITGLVKKPLTFSIEELLELAPLESRIYRFRCVETWSAVVPWVGYSLKKLIDKVMPTKEAKYLRFESYFSSDLPNASLSGYPWPYSEGLRLDEAENDLTLLTFGSYGKPLTKQNGAPVRLVVPWKYGYKSPKALVKIEFVASQPRTLWNDLAPDEYGFYSNVNPDVDHPRWSQTYEKPLGSWFQKEKTLPFNGYSEQVSSLYKGMDLKKFH